MAELLFDRYRPLETLRGGMGEVLVCADHAERSVVALKTFPPERMADVELRERFASEAAIWVQVGAHPHVVRAHIVRSIGDQVYVICDFIAPAEHAAGSSLRAHLQHPVPRALELALGIVRGMRWACERVPGLVHRDLKPENVLVGADGRAKVCDFGLAITPAAEADRSGTRGYMAPEQHAGRADMRSDIYAFGTILDELLGGKPPPAIAPLVAACRAEDPARRPPSWEAVEHVLVARWPEACDGAAAPALPPADEQTREAAILAGWSHHALAHALLDLGHVRDAIQGFQHVVGLAQQSGELGLEAAAWNGLGMAIGATGNAAEAVKALDRSLEIKRARGDRLGEASSLGNRGNAHANLGKLAEAVADFEAAEVILVELGRARELATLDVGHASTLVRLDRFDDALRHARRASEAFRTAGNARKEGAALGTIGQILRKRGDLPGAHESSLAALACFRRVGDRPGEAMELSLLGQTLYAMRRGADAAGAFVASLQLGEALGNRRLVGSTAFMLAQMTPVEPARAASGLAYATKSADAYRAIGRDDLARDADALAAKFRAL